MSTILVHVSSHQIGPPAGKRRMGNYGQGPATASPVVLTR